MSIFKGVKSFTVYSNKLDSGDVIKNNTTIIDDKGSKLRDYVTIFDLYDKSFDDETRVLVGQTVSNSQYIRKEPIGNRYVTYDHTFFFKNGSINLGANTFNWVPGGKNVATIMYGTGEYLGATGYAEFVNKGYKYDECNNRPLLSDEVTFLFSN